MRSIVSRRDFLGRSTRLTFAAAAFPLFQIHVRAQNAAKPWITGNDAIDRPREIALNLLKPTAAQIQHAWELHFNSLVFESYGFAPHSALDAARYTEALKAGATAAELDDVREESSMTRIATDAVERKEFLETFHAAGVTCIFQNTGEEGNDPMRLVKRLARYTCATDGLRPELSKAVTPDDVLAAKKAGKLCLCFTTNGVPLRQEWENTRDELRLVRIFHQLGVRMMHLTYNRRNPLGDGAGEPHDGGLSTFGRAAIAEMNQVGVIVDVAHSGWQTSLEAAKASGKPMVASHTCAGGLYRHFRAKPDDTIKAICDTGGLVGICCIPRFLGGKGDITTFLDHIDYVAKKFGTEHLGIGCDVSYTSRNEKSERAKVPPRPDGSSPFPPAVDRWEHLWPKDDFKTTPEAEKSIAWSNWPIFTVGLVQRGYTDVQIQQIIGQNVLRVLAANRVV